MVCYDFDYAIRSLRQAIDFAEIEHDFIPLRKWSNEVEQSGHELEEMDRRLKHSVGQDVLQANLQSVATGRHSPEDPSRKIRLWLNNGQLKDPVAQLALQVQPA